MYTYMKYCLFCSKLSFSKITTALFLLLDALLLCDFATLLSKGGK